MTNLALRLFGFPQVSLDGTPIDVRRRKEIALLAYLAATQRAHSRDTLAELFWPGYDQTSARGNLRRTLSNLNRSLGGDRLSIDREQVALPPQDGLWVDVAAFHEHLARCEKHGHGREQVCAACLVPLQEAVSLYTDDFLAGFSLADAPEFEVWQVQQAERLRRDLAGALQRLAQCLAQNGDYAEAIPHARRWLGLDPLHEPAQRMLMRLYAQAGDRAAAVRQYEECVRILDSELGMQPEPETTVLYEQIRSGAVLAEVDAKPVVPETSVKPQHNLPEQFTPFIGRAQELNQVQRRLADPHCRLLTVVGPGGIGKTRLAIQAAEEHLDRFPDGVCFVDLAPVGSPDLLASTILHTVAPDEYGDMNAQRRLCEKLRDCQLLLVLDNFEHLLEGAVLLPDLLRSAPDLKIVVTSRERLNLREEWLESLDGLEFSAPDETEFGASSLQTHDATRLFLACVRRVRSGWQPTQADAAAIGSICRTLEGMPLGIELAAAWTRTLPLAEVSAELARGLSILSTSLRDMPARHRSMHAVFDQSWAMLTPNERSVLRQMSVFRGGCTREAAEVITGAGLTELTSLVDSSWLRLRSDGRYDMHELVRQYCEEKLATEHQTATGQNPADVHRRHCNYYGELLKEPVTQMNFRGDVMEVSVPEFDNAQAALRCAASFAYLPAMLPLILSLWYTGDLLGWQKSVYDILGSIAETLDTLRADLDVDEKTYGDAVIALAVIHSAQAVLSTLFGQLNAARDHIQQTEKMVNMMQPGETERFFQADILGKRCVLALFEGDYDAALRYGHMAVSRYEDKDFVHIWPYQEKGQAHEQADMLGHIAYTNWCLGNYDEAEECWQRSIALADTIGEQRFRAMHCLQMARFLVTVGRYDRAIQLAQEGMQGIQAVGDEVWAALAHLLFGQIRYAQYDFSAARSHLLEGVRMWRQSGNYRFLESFTEMGRVELAEGDIQAARKWYEEAIRGIEHFDTPSSKYMVAVWLGLGWAALAEGNPLGAGKMFRKALATGKCAAWEKMEGIAGLAEVATLEGHVEEAAELLSLVVAHPFSAHAQREKSKQSLAALRDRVAVDVFAERADAGARSDLDVTLTELLDQPLSSHVAGTNSM